MGGVHLLQLPRTCPDVKVKGTFWVLEPWVPNPRLAFWTCRCLLRLHGLCRLLTQALPPSNRPPRSPAPSSSPRPVPHTLPPCLYSQPVSSWSPFVCFFPGNCSEVNAACDFVFAQLYFALPAIQSSKNCQVNNIFLILPGKLSVPCAVPERVI